MPADRRTKMLDVLDLERRSVHRQDSHGRVGRQLCAIRCQGKRYGQELLHLVDTAQNERRQLTDAVAEGEPRLADRDVENLFEDSDLRDLHADDGADILHEGRKLGGLARQNSRGEIDLFSQCIAAKRRGRLERGADDRTISRMLEDFGTATQVAHVIATKRDCRGRDPLLEVFACDLPPRRRRQAWRRTGRLGKKQPGWPMTRQPGWSPASPASLLPG